MFWSLRRISWCISSAVFIILMLISNTQAEFQPLSSYCLLVDVDIYYNSSRVGQINFHDTNLEFKRSTFVTHISETWPEELGNSCRGIKVLFDYVGIKEFSKSGQLVLGSTFLYEFEDGGEEEPSEKKLLRCINATNVKHERYINSYNWLTSIPPLKGKDGSMVKPEAALYGWNIRHCCLEKRNATCCPEGAMFVSGVEINACECKQGYYYDTATPFVCHACPIDTYQPLTNMENCLACPKRTITLAKASTSCTPIIECKPEIIWTVKGTFGWDATRVGNTAQHQCPYGPGNVTVMRNCDWASNSTASWAKFESTNCKESKHTETLLLLSETPIAESNVNNITEDLVMETSFTTQLDSYDVAIATTTLNGVVNFNSSASSVAENVLLVLDNILSVDADVLAKSQLQNQTTSQLINVTERFAANVPLQNGFRFFVATNIELKVEAITQESLDEDFIITSNFSTLINSSFIPSEIKIAAKALRHARKQGSNRVISIVYRNNKFFPVFNDEKHFQNVKKRVKIGETILTGKFKDATVEKIDGAIQLKFPIGKQLLNNKQSLSHCVFWDFVANDGFGNWSSDGCFYLGTKSGRVSCKCNHMTNFAILLTADPDRDESDSRHKYALSLISYIGCGVSLLAVVLTLFTYVFFRDLRRSNAQAILCHLCVALAGLLVSYFVVATREPMTTGCLVSSLIVHYFLLASFWWMGVEGINMYFALVKVMSSHVPRFMPKASIIAWGFPVLVVVITGSLAFDNYSTEESCFLHGIAFYVSVFAPVVLVLFVNLIMFGLTIYSVSQMGKEVSQENKIKGYHRVKVALAIMVLLGLTWFFGTVAIGSARLIFQYLFCFFNSLQGFAIFWFHCIRQPEVRQCWADALQGKRGRQRKYTASTTAPALATLAIKKSSSTASASPKFTRALHSRGKYVLEQKAKSLDRNMSTANGV